MSDRPSTAERALTRLGLHCRRRVMMAALLMTCSWAGCTCEGFAESPESDLPRAQIESQTGIAIPTSARKLRSRWVHTTPDDVLWVRFELPNSQLDDFLSAPGVPAVRPDAPSLIIDDRGSDVPWFSPSAVPGHLAGRDPRRKLEILITPRGAWVTVYYLRGL